MPVLQPEDGEVRNRFISRFMGNKRMIKEFPDRKQRVAVAFDTWRDV